MFCFFFNLDERIYSALAALPAQMRLWRHFARAGFWNEKEKNNPKATTLSISRRLKVISWCICASLFFLIFFPNLLSYFIYLFVSDYTHSCRQFCSGWSGNNNKLRRRKLLREKRLTTRGDYGISVNVRQTVKMLAVDALTPPRHEWFTFHDNRQRVALSWEYPPSFFWPTWSYASAFF